MSFLSSIMDLFFPNKCVFCRRMRDGGASICSKCAENLPYTRNGGRETGEFFDFCISPLYYKDTVRDSIIRYKFGGAANYADTYGKLLADCIRENPDVKYDIISWVPLSGRRKRSRGYDQAMLLALATALELDDVAAETLKKPKDVTAQTEIQGGAEARRANISGAYEAADPELITDKRVLLIDDVFTTGSTLSECARTLLMAGAESVVCAALARGE